MNGIVRSWPAVVALGLVVVLSIAMLGIDLFVDRKTAERTTELVENSLRSVAIADDLRYQAYRLSQPNLDVDQISSIRKEIEADARAYDPLATGVGEAAQWERLQALLAHLQHEQPLPATGPSANLVSEIEAAIARLVEINQSDARKSAVVIARAHHDGLAADVIVLAITLVLVGVIGLVLVRSLRRQRALLALHLDTVDERSRELEAFAARTAHDLKSPLNPVVGYADLLSVHTDPEVQQLAKRIRRAGDRMTGIIDDLLALSVAGHPPPGQIAVKPVIEEVLEDLKPNDATLALDLDTSIVAISRGVLSQILRNLVGNAIKYRSPNRPLELAITSRRTGTDVEIVVADNGIGMAPDVLAHATEPYYRAAGASGPGHGLGLAIVKRAVDAVGGALHLESRQGEGTRVTLRFASV